MSEQDKKEKRKNKKEKQKARRRTIFGDIRSDLNAVMKNDPAARNKFEVWLTYSGFHALIYYRLAHFFFRNRCRLIARIISQTARFFTGIEIHPGAQIGRGVFIDHGMGVVIGETAEVGNNVVIYQGVTLGGTGKDKGKRHPTICDNVMISSGAKILGPFTVGEGSKIGAGSVVLKEVPPYSTVVGVPGRVVRRYDKKIAENEDSLDQVKLPDPVMEEFAKLNCQIERLYKMIEEVNKRDKGKNSEK